MASPWKLTHQQWSPQSERSASAVEHAQHNYQPHFIIPVKAWETKPEVPGWIRGTSRWLKEWLDILRTKLVHFLPRNIKRSILLLYLVVLIPVNKLVVYVLQICGCVPDYFLDNLFLDSLLRLFQFLLAPTINYYMQRSKWYPYSHQTPK